MCILCEIKEALEESQTPDVAYLRISKIMTQFMVETNDLVNAVGEHANNVPGEVYRAAEIVSHWFEPQAEAVEDSETDRLDASMYARQFIEELNARGIKAVIVNSPEALAEALKNKDASGDNLAAWTPTGKAN